MKLKYKCIYFSLYYLSLVLQESTVYTLQLVPSSYNGVYGIDLRVIVFLGKFNSFYSFHVYSIGNGTI